MEMGKIKIEFVQLFFCEFWEKKMNKSNIIKSNLSTHK